MRKSKVPVIVIDRSLLNSKAFIELSGTASKILLWFLARRQFTKIKKHWIISNNGEIVFTYAEAKEKYKITFPRFQRALDDLIKHGFIDIKHHGGGLFKDCTKYHISNRWELFGEKDFIKKGREKFIKKVGCCISRNKVS